MSVQAAEPTYEATQRELIATILVCEAEKARLGIQLLALHIQQMITFDAEAREQLQELIDAVRDEIRAVQHLEDTAKALLGRLHRNHRAVYEARQSVPAGGADKSYYTGA